MIETWNQWTSFVEDSRNDDLLLYVVPLHDSIHSVLNHPSILFIKNLRTQKIYYYGFDHPDIKSPHPIDHERVIRDLSNKNGLKFAIDKKSFIHMVPIKGLLDVGFIEYLCDNKVFEVKEFETTAHTLIRRNFPRKNGFGRYVPLVKHLEMFSELAETCQKLVKRAVVDDSVKKFNEFIIEPLAETEKHGLAIDPDVFKEHFGSTFEKSGRVYTQYYYYTSTGRPSNRFGGVNYAALNKEDGTRKAFVSRFGQNGKLVLIDYSAFHPRIISFLIDYPIPVDVDIYEYLAKLYFNKQSVDESDIADAKQITFRQLFGGVEEKYNHIKYLSHLKDFIDYHWRFFNEHGYVETPLFKRRISRKHIHEPKPATVFNYILQATEGEISIPMLGKVNKFLRDKRSKCVLYLYDSILIDTFNEEIDIIKDIVDMMKVENRFPVKAYFGPSFGDLQRIL